MKTAIRGSDINEIREKIDKNKFTDYNRVNNSIGTVKSDTKKGDFGKNEPQRNFTYDKVYDERRDILLIFEK